jgi:hypothetical protein
MEIDLYLQILPFKKAFVPSYVRMFFRGLQCFKLNGNQTENGRYCQKNFFTFCKMFENVQFFSHLHLKFEKSAIMSYDPKIFFS